MFWSRKNTISNPVVKAKSDKLHKRVLRDAKKKIKKGVLTDSHGLALYLQTIDARYSSLTADIANATRVIDYANVRAAKIAETRQLLDFFGQDNTELNHLQQIVVEKAREAKRTDDLRQERISPVDLTKLKSSFDKVAREEDDDER